MPTPLAAEKKLLVEGNEDIATIAYFAQENGIEWGTKKAGYAIKAECYGGADKLLAKGEISTRFKEQSVSRLGIVIDADNEFDNRWNAIRKICLGLSLFAAVPDSAPPGGLLLDTDDGKRLGVWIMPDNKSKGMLETFMACLVPQSCSSFYAHAQDAALSAKVAGATWKECHTDKVHIFTYLAWSDPPGQTFGTAILKSILDAKAIEAKPFLSWFRALYDM